MEGVLIQFSVYCPCKFGQEVVIAGSTSSLGNWDLEHAIQLKYVAHFWWVSPEIVFSEAEIKSGIQYKYVIKSPGTNEYCWEKISNRVLTNPTPVFDFFDDNQRTKFKQDAQPLKVMSFNVRFQKQGDVFEWEDRRTEVAAIVQAENPDLIGFQEVKHGQLNDLIQSLPAYNYVGVGRDDGKTGGEYSPIFIKNSRFMIVESGTFWLSETPHTPSRSWEAACIRICTWCHVSDLGSSIPQHGLFFFNAHLDHISSLARTNGINLIVQEITKRSPTSVILTGDFNATPNDSVVVQLQSNLHDSRQTANATNRNYATFTDWKPKQQGDNTVNWIIDYIFTNGRLNCEAYKTIIEYDNARILASDHRPIVAVFSFKNE